MNTWTTLTTKKRDKGSEKITRSKEPREIALAKIPGPSSQATTEWWGIREKGFNLLKTYFSSKLYLNRNRVNHKVLIVSLKVVFIHSFTQLTNRFWRLGLGGWTIFVLHFFTQILIFEVNQESLKIKTLILSDYCSSCMPNNV